MNNETVLLIGGAGSLGQDLGPKLMQRGYNVAIADLQPVADCQSYHLKADCEESLVAFLAQLDRDGVQIDHVFNFVGALKETGLTDMFKTCIDEIRSTMSVNLMSQILPVWALAPHVGRSQAPDKNFVLTSSINAHHGYSIPFYSAAKGGLHGFLSPASIELGRQGIRLNIVTPGSVPTPVTLNQPKNFEDRANAAALGRLCTVSEVGDAFLACMDLKGMTGQQIVMDAGQSINPAASLYRQQARGVVDVPGSEALAPETPRRS